LGSRSFQALLMSTMAPPRRRMRGLAFSFGFALWKLRRQASWERDAKASTAASRRSFSVICTPTKGSNGAPTGHYYAIGVRKKQTPLRAAPLRQVEFGIGIGGVDEGLARRHADFEQQVHVLLLPVGQKIELLHHVGIEFAPDQAFERGHGRGRIGG